MKTCSRCKEEKPLDDFQNRKKSKDGKGHYCKPCSREYNRMWNATFKERMGKTRQYSKTAEQILRERENKTLREFGIGLEEYDQILEKQGGGCAICGAKENNNKNQKRLPVDHNHETNKVRGILCHSCNLMLGLVKDNAETLERGAAYLKGIL